MCCAEAVLSERDSLAAAVISGVGGQEGGGRLGASDLVVGDDGLSGDGQEGGVAGALRTKPHERLVYQIDSRQYATFATNAAHEGPRAEYACNLQSYLERNGINSV